MDAWPFIAGALSIAASALTTVHILLHKQDTRAAIGWAGLVWLSPGIGVILYWVLGVNRIQRKAQILCAEREFLPLPHEHLRTQPQQIPLIGDSIPDHIVNLALMTEKVTSQPLTSGNQITPLVNGDAAYPAMIDAIKAANRSITLTSYIFDNDQWGKKFHHSLVKAKTRGVEIRVLVDAIGARYSRPTILSLLRRSGVRSEEFMPSRWPWHLAYSNLRSHRKIMVVDGKIGFTGGMNIRAGSVLSDKPKHPTQDVHFRMEGPVVSGLQKVFADDWKFTTGEPLLGELWFPALQSQGPIIARGVSDGPDEDFNSLRQVIFSALACAQKTVHIVTPYFLPDNELVTGLRLATLRGVDVCIILPRKGNLRMVQWASQAGLGELLEAGCEIHLANDPFDHSKLVVIDGAWTLLGSANWDPRSLVLNFEFNVECYNAQFAMDVFKIIQDKLANAKIMKLEDAKARSVFFHLRDRFFRLFSPYL